MTAQVYIQSRLIELSKPLGLNKPSTDKQLIEIVYWLVMSKKFRKYSANEDLQKHIREAIRLNIEAHQPINFTLLQGSYKLWRLEESPEVDWAELFTLMYHTNWLKGICEIYEPGVWFDFFVDDLILPKINDLKPEEVGDYRNSFQQLIDFLRQYQPDNYRVTITGVGEQFNSPQAFDEKLEADVKKFAATLPGGLPTLDQERITTIELNARPSKERQEDPKWREKLTLMHDSYIFLTKRETDYHWKPTKIKVMPQPLPSGVVIAVGSTKDSVVKHWVGVGALKPKDDSFRQLILSPMQLERTNFEFEKTNITGLQGKNFGKIRIIKNLAT